MPGGGEGEVVSTVWNDEGHDGGRERERVEWG
jgi:hypothetical protein